MKPKGWMLQIGTGALLLLILIVAGGFRNMAKGQTDGSGLYTSLSNEKLLLANQKLPKIMLLKDLLSEIEKSYNVSFFYNSKILEGALVSSNILESDSLGLALSNLLDQKGLTYVKETDRTYVIMPKFTELLEIVSGRVTDTEGEPLAGVNILVQGTTIGTSSDADGFWELNVPSLQDTLVFSFVGFQTQVVAINGRKEIDIQLQPQAVAGEELVVVGYGTQRKSDLTGSVSSVNVNNVNTKNYTSVDQLLQGRSAGVQITQSSSEPGGGVSVRIRGTTSINADNEPLYVIDGLPIENSNVTPGSGIVQKGSSRNPLNSLNPSDIESIEVLKDASAAAIYGSRGANGVILITTKKGITGQFQASYDVSTGIQQVAKDLDVMNARQYMTILNALRDDMGEAPEFTQTEIQSAGQGTDWQNGIFRDATVQNHQLSFSGGAENSQYYASFSYFDQEGVLENSRLERYTARVNLTQQAGENFNYGLNLNASLVNDKFAPFGIGTNENAGVINAAIYYDPTINIRDEQGNYIQSNLINLENPVALAKEVTNNAQTRRFFGSLFAEYDILDNLTAKVNLGTDQQTARRDSYNPTVTKEGLGAGGFADVVANQAYNYLIETTLNYQESLSERHQVNILGGYTFQEFINEGLSSSTSAFPTDAFLTNNLSAGDQSNNRLDSGKSQHQLLSYLSRVNYSYDDRYLVTASFRIDGSSRFGSGNKYGYFPSVALAWRLSNENFISNLNLFSNLKLRGSFGITGNQEIGNYNSLTLLSPNELASIGGQLQVGIAPSQIPNPDLKWESTEQYNLGLDIGFYEGRLTASADFFVKNTSDLLLNLPVPSTTGFSSSLQNVGSVKNKGFEMAINFSPFSGEFSWTTSANFSTISNRVNGLADLPFILQGGAAFLPDFTILREGDPINAYYGYIVDGVFQTNDDIVNSPQPQARPGELKFRDIDNDGAITPDDRTILGSPFPKFTFGWTNNFSHKNFDLNIFIQGVEGSDMFNQNLMESDFPTSFRRNRLAEPYQNRWTPENPTNEHPSFVPPEVVYGGFNNSRYVQDNSYLRLSDVTLRYHLPISNLNIAQGASVYVSGKNLITITAYDGYNPEVNALGDSNVRKDFNGYPLARFYNLGLNIRF